MGANCYSHALIGVEIDYNSLWEKKTIKTFPHNHPPEMRFDPQTGAKLWEVAKTPIDGFDGDENLCGFDLVHNTNKRRWIVAACHIETEDVACEKITPEQLSSYRENLRSKLEPLGLWNENSFGLWCVQYWSV